MKQGITLLLFCLIGLRGLSQDAHLSMYDSAPLFLNPAMTGVFDGDWRVHAQYRTQWKSVNFKPYQTALVSFDLPKGKWGFGGQVTNFRAGIGNFNALQASGSVAYTTPLDKGKKHNLSFGIQAGITQKTVEHQLLSYDNQYTTAGGGSFDQTISSGEDFAGQSLVVPVTNAGIMYFFAKQQSRLNPFIGVSAFNLLNPQETFLDQDNRLPMRFYGHLGTRINITEVFYLIPKVLLMRQEQFEEYTIAVEAGYYLKNAETHLTGGLIHRINDAMIATVGAKWSNFVLKLGYDINVSTLSTSSTGRGGFEISLTYIHKKNGRITEKICPRL